MLGYFNNWNVIQFPYKTTSSDDIDKINQFVLDGISDNMSAFVQTSQYGDINTTYTNTIGYYVINYFHNTIRHNVQYTN